jgi:hypothetical protein
MEIKKESLSSPPSVFFAYVVAASLCILIFRLISPGEVPPLPVFARKWGLIQGVLDILALFPALAFSALVLPFGIASDEKSYRGFSPHLFQRMTPPLVTAISAAGLYALLFFLALPLAQNYEANLRYQGEIYRLAKERAQAHQQAGEWAEAYQFIRLCDSIWTNSPDIATLRSDIQAHIDESMVEEHHWATEDTSAKGLNSASISAIPGQGQPLKASDAIAMGETALRDGRMFDAHWLATLGERLAAVGSIEKTKAAQLAARAWNQIESQQPTNAEREAFAIYRLKLSGYQAMVSDDWILAYYIFKELLTLTPNDPDAENYFKASEKGTKEVAFFIDEMETSLGETLTGVVFSLPGGLNREKERSVLRVASFSTHPDYAYGTGIEFMVFDPQSRLLLSLQAPYAKFLPITLDDQPQVLVMMHALNRYDKNIHWEPVWHALGKNPYSPDTAQIILNVSYETFLMLSEMRQRLPSLHINALFAAASIAGETGYIPEVFEAEILNRLGACLFFLPMAVIALIIGWSLRAKYSPRYFFVLSIPVLPLVFHGLTYLYRTVLNTVGISLIYNFGFSSALTVFIVILSISFVLSLIALAAQHD